MVSATTQLKLLANDGKRYLADMLDYTGIIRTKKMTNQFSSNTLAKLVPINQSGASHPIFRNRFSVMVNTHLSIRCDVKFICIFKLSGAYNKCARCACRNG